MPALRLDLTILHHNDVVCPREGGQPVGDHNYGFVFDELCHRALDHRFVFGIDIGGRLVQNDDRRVFQHGARNGNALPLAAGKAGAALADDRIVAVGQRLDEIITAGRLGCRDHLVMRGLRLAELDVVFYGIGKEIHILEYHADLIHQGFEGR